MDPFHELRRRALERHLKAEIAGEVRFDPASRKLYSTDASIYMIEPLGVVLPRSVADLRAAVQIAAEHQVSIVPRGGGTSLSGQSIGPGLVIDCSKYLNRILELDPEGMRVRVEPGVVLDELNRAAAAHGLQFGPDVATATRANLGGMIGNNSAGSRSIVYGMTAHHVRRLTLLLSDGSTVAVDPVTPRDWAEQSLGRSRAAEIHRSVRRIVLEQREEIRRRFPKILRRVSGYDLLTLLEQFDHPRASLIPLVVGSEGTLAFTCEAELGLIRRPKSRGLLVPHFDSLAAAMTALSACLEMKPSAVELIDQRILDLARENLALRQQTAAIQGRPAMIFMVEFSSDEASEVESQIERLHRRLRGVAGVSAVVKANDPVLRDSLWNLRTAGLPLILGVPGDRKPVTFIEDAAVAPERLPEYVHRLRELLQRHQVDAAFYGHASVGCLHVRPVLNLKMPEDVERMRRIAEDTADLVLEFGGSLSGEHGDGLARSEWNRKMFGDAIYQAFRRIKHAFDPENRFNPGKIVDAPAMTDNLRIGPEYHAHEPVTTFDYSRQQGFAGAVEMCNGSGACRKLQGGTMCPSFRATRDEADSTRGRANALRLAMSAERPFEELRSDWVHQVLDLCLMCKACKAECPSNVDLAKLKSEFLQMYHEVHPRPMDHWLLARLHRWMPAAARLAPLVNRLSGNRLARWLLDRLTGIDRRRSLPQIHAGHFRFWFAEHSRLMASGGRRTSDAAGRTDIFLLDDCFTTFQEPQIGKAAVIVFERSGYTVELTSRLSAEAIGHRRYQAASRRPAAPFCCGRTLISKGFLHEVQQMVRTQAPLLADRLDSDGVILGLEPSCLLTLADEWPEIWPSPETRRIAQASHLAESWLAAQAADGRCPLTLLPQPGLCILHGHCHQKALVGMEGSRAALQMVPELQTEVLDAGCCGMAGWFGYEKQHFDLSVAIARLSLVPALEHAPEAVVAATGTSCRHQIRDLTGRTAFHPLELIAARLAD